VRRALPDGLVEEDHAADELLGALRGEQHLAVGPAVLLGRFQADRVEALADGPIALVRGEDTLAFGDERARDFVKVLSRHLLCPPCVWRRLNRRSDPAALDSRPVPGEGARAVWSSPGIRALAGARR